MQFELWERVRNWRKPEMIERDFIIETFSNLSKLFKFVFWGITHLIGREWKISFNFWNGKMHHIWNILSIIIDHCRSLQIIINDFWSLQIFIAKYRWFQIIFHFITSHYISNGLLWTIRNHHKSWWIILFQLSIDRNGLSQIIMGHKNDSRRS